MIRTRTVVVLGAGASKPYGFPIGRELVHRLTSDSSDRPRGRHTESATYREFIKHLKQSTAYSVDRFLEHNPEFVDVGKVALADVLLSCEKGHYLFDHGTHAQNNPSWYQYILHRMLSPFDDFGNNQLTVVTFNYDRSLEHYLFTALGSYFGKNKTNDTERQLILALQNTEIVHVHGQLGKLPWQQGRDHLAECPYDLSDDDRASRLEDAAKGIKIISDTIDGQADPDFQRARVLMKRADRLYFLGFAYDKLNMNRLDPPLTGTDRSSAGRYIAGTCLGSTAAEVNALRKQYPTIRFTDADCYTFLRNDDRFVSEE